MAESTVQPKPKPARTRSAIGRSLDIYYRNTARRERMDRLNAAFVKKGDLVFDIGAHVGDRTGSFARLGARVVALEPQPRVFRALQLIYGSDDQVQLIRSAVGASEGALEMHVNSANPTISTVSPDLITAAQTAKQWDGQIWDRTITVPVTTLDKLIEINGMPDFVKVDVEGYELAVLDGLSHPLRALSFEFTTIQRDVAYACLARLQTLGAYRFNVSLGENHHLELPQWNDADAMAAYVAALPMAANSGDVFAQLA
ncbi:MAG: FkbM family methyltransferase [Pseudomonadota bacterium]